METTTLCLANALDSRLRVELEACFLVVWRWTKEHQMEATSFLAGVMYGLS